MKMDEPTPTPESPNPELSVARYCACRCGGELIRPACMHMARFRQIRYIKGHNFRKPEPAPKQCACGCGEIVVRNPSTSRARFKKQRYLKGHHFGSAESKANMSKKLKAAHNRGCFDAGIQKQRDVGQEQREASLANRAKCQCGCGEPVGRKGAIYAIGCFDGTTPENLAIARAAMNWDKLSPEYSKNMAKRVNGWKESGKLDEIRRKAGNATGMLDHISAKVWIIRDPYGNIFKLSNLSEWARQNTHRFCDDFPESIAPFWKRIAGGMSGLVKKNGRSCSYKGWTVVSNLEIKRGGFDLLNR